LQTIAKTTSNILPIAKKVEMVEKKNIFLHVIKSFIHSFKIWRNFSQSITLEKNLVKKSLPLSVQIANPDNDLDVQLSEDSHHQP